MNSGPKDLIKFRYFYTKWIIATTPVYHPIFGILLRDLNYGPWAREENLRVCDNIQIKGWWNFFALHFAMEEQDVKLKLDFIPSMSEATIDFLKIFGTFFVCMYFEVWN